MSPGFASIYVHFPFCESKCHYCDFYSLGRERTKETDPFDFAQALEREARSAGLRLADKIDTIFFGGGTPSMTPALDMERALAPLELGKRIHAETEWTMEANPSSVTLEALRDYRALGVNRLSMGVQAMRPDLLARLGRVHSREAVFRALDAALEAGIANISVDLLCGVPGQDLPDLEKALEELTAYPIQHLSCYLLTLAPHHRMYPELPREDTQLEHLLFIDRWLGNHGFEHYEISNFAKPRKQARHNLSYWKGCSYLGLGPSAHSFCHDSGKRWKNVSSLHKYSSLLKQGETPVEWTEELTASQKDLERWMLSLRLAEGFPSSWTDSPPRRGKAQALMHEGLLEAHPSIPGRLRLTSRGFALSDQIIATLA